MSRYDIAVIGGGLSGMLASLLLSKEGRKVCLLEKEEHIGGAVSSFKKNGKTFSTGLHYFGGLDEEGPLYRYWKYFGLADTGLFERMDGEAFDMISLGGRDFPLASGKEKFLGGLAPFFPGSEDLIADYLNELDRITAAVPFYNIDLNPETAGLSFRSESGWDFFRKFDDGTGLLPEVLAGNNFIYGAGKEDLSLYMASVINHSFIGGAWRLKKGYGSSALAGIIAEKLRANDCRIVTGCEIKEISGGNAFKLHSLSGEIIEADNIVSTLHPAVTLKLLKGIPVRNVYSSRIGSLENTPGAFTLFIELKEGSFRHLPYNVHYFSQPGVWFNEDEETPGHFMLYTTAGNEGYADTAVVMMRSHTSAYNRWQDTSKGRRGNDYIDFKHKIAGKLLDLVSKKFPSFRQHILNFTISTPLTWRDYTGTPGGSMYGVLKSYRNFPLAPVNPKTVVPGLYLAGQSTGIHGVLGVTIGVVNACCQILGQDYVLNRIRNV